MEPEQIRRQIRERLTSGELPLGHPQRVWAGFGTGQTCAICDASIPPRALEIEAHGADDKYRYYHRDCYLLLVDERFRAARPPDPS